MAQAFTIPNAASAEDPTQAQVDSRDFGDMLVQGFQQTGVVSGCAVTAQGTPNMTVAVAAGTVMIGGVNATVAGGNVTITAADPTNARFDLICVDSGGTKSAVAGSPSANPIFPDPAGKVVIAAVRVPAAASSINAAKIVDKRVIIVAGAGLPADTVVPAATRIISNKLLAGDAQPSWRVLGSGEIDWGPGGSTAPDVSITRGWANTLITNGSHMAYPATPTTAAYGSAQTGDGFLRFTIDGNGQITWGPGNIAGDVSLFRGGGGMVQCSGHIWAQGTLVSNLGSVANQIYLQSDGKITFGQAADTNLYRYAANILKTDSQFQSATQIRARAGTSGQMDIGGDPTLPTIYFGTAQDTNLYRVGVNTLKTDGAFQAGTAVTTGFTLALGNISFQTFATGDTNARWYVTNSGILNWGPGNAGGDTNLYRVSAGVLKTDGHFLAGAAGQVRSYDGAAQQVSLANPGGFAGIYFGPANDTALYRPSAGVLKTDGAFVAGTTIDGDMHQYLGDWAAGSYLDGDIVVYNGQAYICVRPTSATPGAGWTPTSAVNYATTLPSSPYDGQIAVLVDSLTNPTYQWMFRYNAGSTSAYKWEFIGGADIGVDVETQENTSGTLNAWVNLATVGPQFVAPRAGDYTVSCGFSSNDPTNATQSGISINGANPTLVIDGTMDGSGSIGGSAVSRTSTFTAVNAGSNIRQMYWGANSGTWFRKRWIRVIPRRVA